MVQYILHLLSDRHLGVISRGYGRKTKGFREITDRSTAEEVGDEPLMLANNNPKVRFFVSEDRVKGLALATTSYPDLDTFVFDDVFQHRYIKPNVLILLSDYNRPFYRDHVMPYGRLREKRSGASRASAIVVSKCPEHLSIDEKETILKSIRTYSKAPVFFAQYTPQAPKNALGQGLVQGEKVVLLSALANNDKFKEQQSRVFDVVQHYTFRDHYQIPSGKIRSILENHPDVPLICTEKDMVKIGAFLEADEKNRFYVPVIGVHMEESFGNYLRTQLGFA